MLLMCMVYALIFSAQGASAATKAPVTKTITESRYDLDGDGKKDKITLVLEKSYGDDGPYDTFTIKVGGQALTRSGDLIIPKIVVVDIDKTDGQKEIIICDNGPSDDPQSFCFSYPYQQLYDLGILQGHPLYTRGVFKVNGDGTVTTPVRADILQTWWYSQTFQMNERTQRFDSIVQNVYDSTKVYPVTVTKDFSALEEMKKNAKTETIKKGQKIKINGTDDKNWIRFEDASGKTRWVYVTKSDLMSNGVTLANCLDGLEFFD